MLQIHTFEHVFGIKKWQNPSGLSFKSLNVIYAPNGTAKSSFSDGLEAISRGDLPQGTFPNDPSPKFELSIDGKKITDDQSAPFDCVVFHGAKAFPLQSDVAQRYILTDSKKNKADRLLGELRGVIDEVKGLGPKYWTRGKTDRIFSFCSAMYPREDKDCILAFLLQTDFDQKPFPFSISKEDMDILLSPALNEIAANAIDPRLIKAYKRALSKAKRDVFLDSDFNVDEFETFLEKTKESGFFSPKRRLKLGRSVVSEAEAYKLLDKKKAKIFSDPDVSKARDQIRKAFSKKANKNVWVLFDRHPDLIAFLDKPGRLMAKAFLTFFSDDLAFLKEKKSEAKRLYNQLEKLLDPAMRSVEGYRKVWETFKNRFSIDSFEVEVIEEREPLTGLAIPALRKLYPGSNIAVPEDNRLSDGEKKTFYLINLILQIELLSKSGEPWHVVFDDAVDSFDYRNKYAFLQYLADLAPRIKKGQVFVLTHSFDFYRGLIHTLRSLTRSEHFSFKQNVGQFWLKKDLGGGILVMDSAAVEDYVDFGKLSSWKHQTGERFFAFIAIDRGIKELQGKSEARHVPYLHFLSDTTTFETINKGLFGRNGQRPYGDDEVFQKHLFDVCDALLNGHPQELDLDKKLCLALAIRRLRERFLIKKAEGLGLKTDSSGSRMKVVNSLEGKVIRKLSDPVIEKAIIRAKILSNPNVHVNDFAFEPIVDIGMELFLSSYQELKQMNSAWPFGTVLGV